MTDAPSVCCNGCGGDILIGPALCVACTAALRAECDALRAENAKLREMYLLATSIHTMTDEQLAELVANAKAASAAPRKEGEL